jgi:hypothetical protein
LWSELLDEVWDYVRGAWACRPGRNVMVYLDDVPNVEVGVEMEGALAEPSARVVASVLPDGRAATTVARGAPSPAGDRARHTPRWSSGARPTATPRTGVRWEVYDHWRERPRDVRDGGVLAADAVSRCSRGRLNDARAAVTEVPVVQDFWV